MSDPVDPDEWADLQDDPDDAADLLDPDLGEPAPDGWNCPLCGYTEGNYCEMCGEPAPWTGYGDDGDGEDWNDDGDEGFDWDDLEADLEEPL